MSKIATITFHRSKNYGAVLQAVALQKAVIGLGYDNDVIDYEPKARANMYTVIDKSSLKSFIKSTIKTVLHPSHAMEINKKNELFKSFLRDNLKQTNSLNKSDLKMLDSQYDKFITGSDQVWNIANNKHDAAYFLDFVSDNMKCVSYAASFGVNEVEEADKEWYVNNLNHFQAILTREQSGADIVYKLIQKKASVVLDPVFLLEKKDWDKMKADAYKEKYIFMYMPTSRAYTFAKKLSIKTGIPIKYLCYDLVKDKKKDFCGEIIFAASPSDFLSLISSAQYVVSGSFHATAFSIIYNKDFYSDAPTKTKTRVSGLLETLGLPERMITSDDMEQSSFIDYVNVNNKLVVLRKKSLDILEKILQ